MSEDLEQTTITPGEAYEQADDAAPATTVLDPGASAGGSRRWAIAAAVVGALVIASALAVSLFTGRAANATVLGYVPADSIMYGEFRMDLPGDQRQAVGEFLSKFPGFADQSTIETKIDEVLDRLVGGATDGSQAFSSDIKPWFGGELAFSVGALPDPAEFQAAPEGSGIADARFLLLVSVKDATAAGAWFEGVVGESGAATTSEAYGSTTIHTFAEGGQPSGAFAIVDGKVAVAGDPTSVRAAIDSKGAGTLGSNVDFKAALDATTGDHIGFMFIAVRPLLDWSSELAGDAVVGGVDSDILTGLVPDWTAFALRVEGDALRMETIAPTSDAAAAASRTATVAEHVPSGAIALSVSNDYGKGLLATLETYRAEPSLKELTDGLDQAIGFLGGADAAIGWIGDLGVAVTRVDGGLEGGLVITPTDGQAATNLFTSLKTLASLGGSTAGIAVRDEAYAGTTITIIDLGSLEDLAGLAGAAGAAPEMLGTDLPAGQIELAYAITDQVVVLGANPGFVRSVLDTTAATSLAQNERYKSLVAMAGGGSGSGFADITAIRELIEAALVDADPGARAEYEENVKPFLVPIDALVASSSLQGEVNRSTVIVTVK